MDLDLEECTSTTPIGFRCHLKVAALTPTQNAVGLDEVNDKVARYSAKKQDDLKDYLIVHPVPVVIGNGGKFYLTDHHHLANALWKTAEGKNKAGIDTGNARVAVTVLHNLANLKDYHFWKAMQEARLVYLYDHTMVAGRYARRTSSTTRTGVSPGRFAPGMATTRVRTPSPNSSGPTSSVSGSSSTTGSSRTRSAVRMS
jgi:hypothetical protein